LEGGEPLSGRFAWKVIGDGGKGNQGQATVCREKGGKGKSSSVGFLRASTKFLHDLEGEG